MAVTSRAVHPATPSAVMISRRLFREQIARCGFCGEIQPFPEEGDAPQKNAFSALGAREAAVALQAPPNAFAGKVSRTSVKRAAQNRLHQDPRMEGDQHFGKRKQCHRVFHIILGRKYMPSPMPSTDPNIVAIAA